MGVNTLVWLKSRQDFGPGKIGYVVAYLHLDLCVKKQRSIAPAMSNRPLAL